MANVSKSHQKVRMLCEGAIFLALAQILGYLKFMELPNGGSLTPAMFPLVLFALRWGVGWGVLEGVAFAILQILFDKAIGWGWQALILDYLLAFPMLGLAGLFKGHAWGFFPGAVLGCTGRFLMHFWSGVTLWRIVEPTEVPGLGTFSDPTISSLVYNGSYMLPTLILTLVIGGLLYVPLKKYYAGKDLRA